jgi:hypothetical protein
VILLEIEPEKQNTKIDLLLQQRHWYSIVLLLKLLKREKLFYKNESGHEVLIKRIYNRVILTSWT